MNAPAQVKAPPAAPVGVAEQRASTLKWVMLQARGIGRAVDDAAQLGTWAAVDEAVRYTQSVADQLRAVRDSIPNPQAPPADQLGWAKTVIADGMQAMQAFVRQHERTFLESEARTVEMVLEILRRKEASKP